MGRSSKNETAEPSPVEGSGEMMTPDLPPTTMPVAALRGVRAVASLLHCSQRHVYRLADADQMPPPVRIGALVRWKLDGPGDLREWIDAGCPRCRKAP